jgi:hypothetical protein
MSKAVYRVTRALSQYEKEEVERELDLTKEADKALYLKVAKNVDGSAHSDKPIRPKPASNGSRPYRAGGGSSFGGGSFGGGSREDITNRPVAYRVGGIKDPATFNSVKDELKRQSFGFDWNKETNSGSKLWYGNAVIPELQGIEGVQLVKAPTSSMPAAAPQANGHATAELFGGDDIAF